MESRGGREELEGGDTNIITVTTGISALTIMVVVMGGEL